MTPDEQKIMEQVITSFNSSFDSRQEADRRSDLAKNYMSGNSWDRETVNRLKEAGLPHIRSNILWPIFMRLWGAQRQSSGRVRIIPLSNATNEQANALNRLFEAIDSQIDSFNSLNQIYDQAFQQSTLTELAGWFEVINDTSIDPRGLPVIKLLDANDVYYDPETKNPDLSDCRYVIKTWFLTKDQIISWVRSRFPNKLMEVESKLKEKPRSWINSISDTLKSFKRNNGAHFIDGTNGGRYRLINMFVREDVDVFKVFERGKGFKIVDESTFQDAIKNGSSGRKDRKKRIKSIITVSRDIVLEHKETIVQNSMFPLFPVWGLWLEGRNLGLGWQITGHQEEHQAARSSELHVINSVANSGWIIQENSLTDEQEVNLDKNGAKTGLKLFYKPGFNEPKKIQPNILPSGMINRANEARSDAEQLSAITPNTRGMRDSSNETGILLQRRVQQAMITNEPFLRNLTIAKERAFAYRVELAQRTITSERRFSILNSDKTQEELILNQNIGGFVFNDIRNGRFGAKVEESATTASEKTLLLESLLGALQNAPAEITPWHVIFSLFDWPDEQKEEIIRYVQDRLPPGRSEQQLSAAVAQGEQ